MYNQVSLEFLLLLVTFLALFLSVSVPLAQYAESSVYSTYRTSIAKADLYKIKNALEFANSLETSGDYNIFIYVPGKVLIDYNADTNEVYADINFEGAEIPTTLSSFCDNNICRISVKVPSLSSPSGDVFEDINKIDDENLFYPYQLTIKKRVVGGNEYLYVEVEER